MALELTGEEFEDIRDSFKALDLNGDGKICKTELKIFFETNTSDDEIAATMRMMDKGIDGDIEFPEFLEMVAFFEYDKGKWTSWKIRQMFRALDKHDSGNISSHDIIQAWDVFPNLGTDVAGQKKIEDIIKGLDANGVGKIDIETFIKKIEEILVSKSLP